MKKNTKQYDRSIIDTPQTMEMNAVMAEGAVENEEGKEERIIARIGLADQKEDPSYKGTYDEFIQKFTDDIRALGYTDEDLDVHTTEDGKDVLDIRAHLKGGTVKLRAFLGDLYLRAIEESYENTLNQILDQIRNTEADMKEMHFPSIRLSGTYEELRENLIIRPLNSVRYYAKLKNGIFHQYGDIALVLYLVLADLNGKLMTRMIEKRELEEWRMSDQSEEIFSEALKQTAKRYPAAILSEKDNKRIDLLNGVYQKEDVMSPDGEIQLSSSIGTNGAAAMFYPGVSEKIAELMHGKYAAVFMNTSDVMILKQDSQNLKRYMQFAGTENAYGEMLSGRKYLFDDEGKLVNA